MDVQTEDLNKAISEVVERFDGVEEISVEQREGIENFIQRTEVLAVLPTGIGKSLLFQLLPGICLALNKMGYTSYPKSAIILVICPLNALIESHMKDYAREGFHFVDRLYSWWSGGIRHLWSLDIEWSSHISTSTWQRTRFFYSKSRRVAASLSPLALGIILPAS